jgi:hypothetical protein
MAEYRVEWIIEVYADSPREAAQKAWQLMRNEDSQACFFSVLEMSDNPSGIPVQVDLLEDATEGEENNAISCTADASAQHGHRLACATSAGADLGADSEGSAVSDN